MLTFCQTAFNFDSWNLASRWLVMTVICSSHLMRLWCEFSVKTSLRQHFLRSHQIWQTRTSLWSEISFSTMSWCTRVFWVVFFFVSLKLFIWNFRKWWRGCTRCWLHELSGSASSWSLCRWWGRSWFISEWGCFILGFVRFLIFCIAARDVTWVVSLSLYAMNYSAFTLLCQIYIILSQTRATVLC